MGLIASAIISYYCGKYTDHEHNYAYNDEKEKTDIIIWPSCPVPDYWKYFIRPRNFSTYLLKRLPIKLNQYFAKEKNLIWLESKLKNISMSNSLSYYDKGNYILGQPILNYMFYQNDKNWIYYIRPIDISTGSFSLPTALNKYDGENRKTGVWVESDHTNDFDRFMAISYYYKGLKNGLSQTYRNNQLASIAYFRQGKLQAPYVVFNYNQMVSYIMTEIKPVEEFKDRVPGWMTQESDDSTINQGYFIALSPEGRIMQEGWRIFTGNFDGIRYLNVGKHIIYDSDSTSYTKSY